MNDRGPAISCGCAAILLVVAFGGAFLIVNGVLVLQGYTVVDDWFDDGGPPVGSILTGSAMTLCALVGWRIARGMQAEKRHWQRVRSDGAVGTAFVTEVVAAGGSHNGMPRWTLRIELRIPGRPAITTIRVMALPHDVAAGLPGRDLAIRVDPADPSKWLFADRLGLLDDPRLA